MKSHRWAIAAAVVAVAACSGGGHRAAEQRTPTPASASSSSSPAPAVRDRTVWLCRPGADPDPCATDLTTTAVTADGKQHAQPAPPAYTGTLDCFYVYPTVSRESGANADLRVQQAEIDVAVAQAARFSTVCNVWAPMYRQRTVQDLYNLADDAPRSAANALALASVRAAWRDYLAHDNAGHRVVFIGHSQGAAMLIRLLRADVDPSPTLRARASLALLLGGNVTVRSGQLVGGSFQHLPLCSHPGEAGCVIAYSSFPSQPPAASLFGRPGFGVSYLAGETSTVGLSVACVNPAAIAGGKAALHPYLPASAAHADVPTPWVAYPGRYRAQCRSGGGATWLQVTPTGGAADRRPKVTEELGPLWGFHIVDVNLALGDLVADVGALDTSR